MFLFLYGSEWQDLSGCLCNQCFCFFWSVASFHFLRPGCCFLTHTGYMCHNDKPTVPLAVLEIIPCLWHSVKIFTFCGLGVGGGNMWGWGGGAGGSTEEEKTFYWDSVTPLKWRYQGLVTVLLPVVGGAHHTWVRRGVVWGERRCFFCVQHGWWNSSSE